MCASASATCAGGRPVAERAAPATWVEIRRVLLEPDERAPQVPDDTRRVPLELRVKGFLVAAARLGEPAEIVTPAGRRLRGTLAEINPAYAHGFGAPLAELTAIGAEVRRLLRDRGRDED